MMSTTLLLKKLLNEIELQNGIALHYYPMIKFKIVGRVKYYSITPSSFYYSNRKSMK